ncbi:PadR family transcriptional regulator [Candidatus Woesearchaeota archaeon]|nr:PadR family transcriptional regulator [Candidatus Woesearchaeota archaeon]
MIRGHLKFTVLNIVHREPMSGYQLMNKIQEIIGIKPSPGSVYPLLETLYHEGLLKIREQGRKKIYYLTREGRKRLKSINIKKQEILDKLAEGINLLESICKEKQVKFFRLIFNQLNQGKIPLYNLNPELAEFRGSLIPFIESKNHQNINKVKKILKETTRKLKTLK